MMETTMTNFDDMMHQLVPLLDEWDYERRIPPADIARFLISVAADYVPPEDWTVMIEAGLNLEGEAETRSWARH
jgi:hypothetical protein